MRILGAYQPSRILEAIHEVVMPNQSPAPNPFDPGHVPRRLVHPTKQPPEVTRSEQVPPPLVPTDGHRAVNPP